MPSPLRDLISNVLAQSVSRSRAPVIVNSFGRSGSTLLYSAVVASAVNGWAWRRIAEPAVAGQAWRLNHDPLVQRRIYKSHDYPAPHMRRDAKVLYVFGDPVDATISVLNAVEKFGDAWLALHCEHLRVPRCTTEQIIESDALGISQHLRTWLSQENNEVLFVRYESLWQHQQALSDFLGFRVELPTRRARKSGETASRLDQRLRRTYGDVSALVASLPSCFTSGPGGQGVCCTDR